MTAAACRCSPAVRNREELDPEACVLVADHMGGGRDRRSIGGADRRRRLRDGIGG